jgi:PKD repeat protein
MRKKINLIYSVFLSSIFALIVYSCAREEGIPVTADFSIKIVNEDYSVPVKIEITNKSTGAETYEWSFEGASVTSSTEKTPFFSPVIDGTNTNRIRCNFNRDCFFCFLNIRF